jgi:enoyl-CoA hydratase/carnithine racemase
MPNLPDYETLLLQTIDDDVLVVTLNRPEALNAITTQMGLDRLDLWQRLTADAGALRAVVVTGAGERAFCAGGDLKQRKGMSDAEWRHQHEIFEREVVALWDCPIPVIAAVNGHAYGGGLEFALSCDFIYAAAGASFALSETKLGIMPGGGGTQTLARAVGERRAKELIFSARPFSAEEAARWGLVNEVCERSELMPRALACARRIADNAPLSVRQAKKSIHHGLQTDLMTGYRYEIEAYNRLVVSQDRHEGVLAFNEKRKPRFKGE